MATAHKIRAIIHARERSGASHPQRLLNRSNRTIGPLFSRGYYGGGFPSVKSPPELPQRARLRRASQQEDR
eukprot:scaffold32265_cov129-Isochrysis_galbana.AAC.1